MHDTIECVNLVEKVTDCLEEALDPDLLLTLFDHLQCCPPCDVYFSEVQATIQLVANLPAPSLAGNLADDLLAEYREWSASTSA